MGFVEFERRVLPHAVACEDILTRTWADEPRCVVVGDGALEQQLVFTVGVDGEVRLDEIQVVIPVVHPVAFGVICREMPVCLAQHGGDEGFGRHRERQILALHRVEQAAGREGCGQDRSQPFGAVHERKQAGVAFGWHGEAAAQDDQGIVAVGLDQAQQVEHLRVAHGRVEQHVAAPVLVDIAVRCIALRIELRGEVKAVVISFQVAVPAAIEVIARAVQLDGPAAAQDVIQQRLPAITVEASVSRACSHRGGQRLRERRRFRAFRGNVRRLTQPAGRSLNDAMTDNMTHNGRKGEMLAGAQCGRCTRECARCTANGDLAFDLEFGQGVRCEVVRVGQGGVVCKDERRVDNDGGLLQSAWRVACRAGPRDDGQVEMACLDRGHLSFVADRRLDAVIGNARFEMIHRHPGFDGAANHL